MMQSLTNNADRLFLGKYSESIFSVFSLIASVVFLFGYVYYANILSFFFLILYLFLLWKNRDNLLIWIIPTTLIATYIGYNSLYPVVLQFFSESVQAKFFTTFGLGIFAFLSSLLSFAFFLLSKFVAGKVLEKVDIKVSDKDLYIHSILFGLSLFLMFLPFKLVLRFPFYEFGEVLSVVPFFKYSLFVINATIYTMLVPIVLSLLFEKKMRVAIPILFILGLVAFWGSINYSKDTLLRSEGEYRDLFIVSYPLKLQDDKGQKVYIFPESLIESEIPFKSSQLSFDVIDNIYQKYNIPTDADVLVEFMKKVYLLRDKKIIDQTTKKYPVILAETSFAGIRMKAFQPIPVEKGEKRNILDNRYAVAICFDAYHDDYWKELLSSFKGDKKDLHFIVLSNLSALNYNSLLVKRMINITLKARELELGKEFIFVSL